MKLQATLDPSGTVVKVVLRNGESRPLKLLSAERSFDTGGWPATFTVNGEQYKWDTPEQLQSPGSEDLTFVAPGADFQADFRLTDFTYDSSENGEKPKRFLGQNGGAEGRILYKAAARSSTPSEGNAIPSL